MQGGLLLRALPAMPPTLLPSGGIDKGVVGGAGGEGTAPEKDDDDTLLVVLPVPG